MSHHHNWHYAVVTAAYVALGVEQIISWAPLAAGGYLLIIGTYGYAALQALCKKPTHMN